MEGMAQCPYSALWGQLEEKVAAKAAAFPGVAGVCVTDLKSRNEIAVNGDEVFPIASTIKIPILLTLLQRAAQGELNLEERIPVTEEMHTPGSGVLTYLDHAVELSVLDIANLMMMVSDNTATNLCIDWATKEAINDLMESLGLSGTRIRRKMQDQESVVRNQENVSTPREGSKLMQALYDGQPNAEVARQCLAILTKPNRGPIERAMATGVKVSNKPGGMERVRCDLGIVWLRRIPYAIAVMTKFGMGHPYALENRVVEIVRLVHGYMEAIDGSSQMGQGVPRSVLDAHTQDRPA